MSSNSKSLLTSQEYRVLDHWRINPPGGFCYEEIDHVCHRIAHEIERLERENKRLQAEVVDLQLESVGLSAFSSRPDALSATQVTRPEETPHDHGPKPKERTDQLILDGLVERVAVLEERVASLVRLSEAQARAFVLPPVGVYSSSWGDHNPFESVRPPRAL